MSSKYENTDVLSVMIQIIAILCISERRISGILKTKGRILWILQITTYQVPNKSVKVHLFPNVLCGSINQTINLIQLGWDVAEQASGCQLPSRVTPQAHFSTPLNKSVAAPEITLTLRTDLVSLA